MDLQRIIAVDWSGDKGPGQKKKIWAAVWTRHPRGKVAGGTMTLESGRTREQLTTWLIALAAETPRIVAGIDLCFSYPAWFLQEHGSKTVFDFWQQVAAGKGEQWLGTTCLEQERDPRFWGRPHKRPAEFSGNQLHRMMRATDWENKIEQGLTGGDPARAALMKGVQPKSPFQIGGSGSVGTGSLRGMPWLLHLWQQGWRIWPFQDYAEGKPMLVEMYTRLLTGPVKKANPEARAAYLARRKQQDPAFYAKLPRTVVADAQGSEDAFDALVSCLEMVRAQHEFLHLHATQDPRLLLEGITWRPGVTP